MTYRPKPKKTTQDYLEAARYYDDLGKALVTPLGKETCAKLAQEARDVAYMVHQLQQPPANDFIGRTAPQD